MKALMATLPPLLLALLGASITIFSWIGLPVLLLGLADSWGRYNDYRYLKGFGYLPLRMADYYGRSFCGRWLVSSMALPVRCLFVDLTSGDNLAAGWQWRRYYRSRGYRWWHLFPDGFPSVLTKSTFWRNLLKGHT